MFSETARFYDIIYDEFKDFNAEADQIAEILRRLAPQARTVLDVGCGTGRHAAALTDRHGFDVHGLDLEPAFVEIAQERCPNGRFQVADMAGFRLGRSYDLVLCLFSSIGYVKTRARLASTAASIRAHLNPGGLALIEPWFQPHTFFPGRVHFTTVDREDLKIVRMNTARVEEGVSILDFHYLIGKEGRVEHLEETHELALFTQEEMREGFAAGGLRVAQYDPQGLTGRGLYLLEDSGTGAES